MIVGAVPVVAAAIGAVGALAVQFSQKVEAPGSEMAPVAPSTPVPATADRLSATPFPAATPAASQAQLRRRWNRVKQRGHCETLESRRGWLWWRLPGFLLPASVRRIPGGYSRGGSPTGPRSGQRCHCPCTRWPSPAKWRAACEPSAPWKATRSWWRRFWTDPGAVALVPAEMVDFRVQALAVGEDDPLDKPVGGESPVRIGVVGDIVPGRNVHLHMLEYGDFTRPFQRVAPLLRSFDVTVANLEGNLSETLPQPADPHSVSFVSSPAMLEGFTLAGH